MSNFYREYEAMSSRSASIRAALRDYESALTAEYGSPYAAMSGTLESLLTGIASTNKDTTEELVNGLRKMTKRLEKVEA